MPSAPTQCCSKSFAASALYTLLFFSSSSNGSLLSEKGQIEQTHSRFCVTALVVLQDNLQFAFCHLDALLSKRGKLRWESRPPLLQFSSERSCNGRTGVTCSDGKAKPRQGTLLVEQLDQGHLGIPGHRHVNLSHLSSVPVEAVLCQRI